MLSLTTYSISDTLITVPLCYQPTSLFFVVICLFATSASFCILSITFIYTPMPASYL